MTRPRTWVPRLTRFVLGGMVFKLRRPENERKADWRDLPRSKLFEMLRDELAELTAEAQTIGPLEKRLAECQSKLEGRLVIAQLARRRRRAQLEAADIGNLAMMIFDRLEEDIRRDVPEDFVPLPQRLNVP